MPPPIPIQLVSDLHYEELYRFAHSLAGQDADARDLTQHTMMVYARKGEDIREPEKVKSWLFTTLHREFLRQRRKMSRFTSLSSQPDGGEESLAILDSSTQSAANEMDASAHQPKDHEVVHLYTVPIHSLASPLPPSSEMHATQVKLGRQTQGWVGQGVVHVIVAQRKGVTRSKEEIDRAMAELKPLMYEVSSAPNFRDVAARLHLTLPAGATQQQAAEAILKWAEGLPVLQQIMQDVAKQPWPKEVVERLHLHLPWDTAAAVFTVLLDAASAAKDTKKMLLYLGAMQNQVSLSQVTHPFFLTPHLESAFRKLTKDPQVPAESLATLLATRSERNPTQRFRENLTNRSQIARSKAENPKVSNFAEALSYNLVGQNQLVIEAATAERNALLFTPEGPPHPLLHPFHLQHMLHGHETGGQSLH